MTATPVTPLLTWFLIAVVITPFLFSSLLATMGVGVSQSTALIWLTTWSAIVLSFTGGARWGLEVASRGNVFLMLTGLAPAILAWAALNLPLQYQGGKVPLAIMAAAFVASGLWDLLSPTTPRWYKPMAVVITLAALLGLAVAFWRVDQLGL